MLLGLNHIKHIEERYETYQLTYLFSISKIFMLYLLNKYKWVYDINDICAYLE